MPVPETIQVPKESILAAADEIRRLFLNTDAMEDAAEKLTQAIEDTWGSLSNKEHWVKVMRKVGAARMRMEKAEALIKFAAKTNKSTALATAFVGSMPTLDVMREHVKAAIEAMGLYDLPKDPFIKAADISQMKGKDLLGKLRKDFPNWQAAMKRVLEVQATFVRVSQEIAEQDTIPFKVATQWRALAVGLRRAAQEVYGRTRGLMRLARRFSDLAHAAYEKEFGVKMLATEDRINFAVRTALHEVCLRLDTLSLLLVEETTWEQIDRRCEQI